MAQHQRSSALKVALIGCGTMAKVHLRMIQNVIPLGSIAACDLDELRLRDFCHRTGIQNSFSDISTLLTDFQPDVVHVITPPVTHKAVAIYCLQNNAHVLVEKPMCITSEEADEIVEASRTTGKMVCVNHMRSFDPSIIRAKTAIRSGLLGPITNINVSYSYDYLKRFNTDASARWIKTLPGGCFFDLMPHVLCLIDDFLSEMKIEHCSVRNNQRGVITDIACHFSSREGTANLHMSLNIFPLVNFVEFEGEQGTLRVDFRNFLFIIRRARNLPNAVERVVGNVGVGFQYIGQSIASVVKFLSGRLDPYTGMEHIIDEFYKAVENGGRSPVPAQKAQRLLGLTEEILKDTRSEYSSQALNRQAPSEILVTGATGFIGRRLVTRLLGKGYRVRVFSRRAMSSCELATVFKGEVDLFVGDISVEKHVQDACSGIEIVYHLAAAMQGEWMYHLDTTITGTKNMLQAANGNNVKRFVYFSTLNVYNAKRFANDLTVAEDYELEDEPSKRGAYSHSKLCAEEMVRAFVSNGPMSIVILRPGLVYGPGGPIIPGDVGRFIGRKLMVVLGMGSRVIPFVYIDNVVDAAVAAGEAGEKVRGMVFNVVDGERISQRDYIRRYRELSNHKFVVACVPFVVLRAVMLAIEMLVRLCWRKEMFLRYKLGCVRESPRFSTNRIEQIIGWGPRVNFREGFKRTFERLAGSQPRTNCPDDRNERV